MTARVLGLGLRLPLCDQVAAALVEASQPLCQCIGVCQPQRGIPLRDQRDVLAQQFIVDVAPFGRHGLVEVAYEELIEDDPQRVDIRFHREWLAV